MTPEKIAVVLAEHARWIRDEGGNRANFDDANLAGANLAGARLDRARLVDANLAGANLAGANLYGARLDGANFDGANLAGANLYGARLYGANLAGANLYGANLDGANLYGASLAGANLAGAKINNDKTAIRILRRATRSDSYEFFLWHCQDGIYIKAGCRFFDMAQARQHWTATRAGTLLGDETQDILDMFEKAIERQVQS